MARATASAHSFSVSKVQLAALRCISKSAAAAANAAAAARASGLPFFSRAGSFEAYAGAPQEGLQRLGGGTL